MSGTNLWLGSDVNSVAVMSDVHLGASNCVLNDLPDPLDDGGVFQGFLEREIGKVDAFVLLGDIYELALSTYDKAVPRVERLITVIKKVCDSRIIVVPGNHDHYVWTLMRDHMEIIKRFPSFPSDFLPTSIHSWYPKTSWGSIEVAYPNVYWSPPDAGRKSMIFHHGHYCSDTYTIISDFYRDLFGGLVTTIDEVEGINSGWLDLVWYHLGQAVGVNKLVEKIYADLREKGESIPLRDAIAKLYKQKLAPKVRQALHEYADKKAWLPQFGADFIADQLEKHLPDLTVTAVRVYADDGGHHHGEASERSMPLDEALVERCDKYVTTTIASEPLLKNRQLQMIFGHTHKHGFASGKTAAYANTGGWIAGPKGEWPDSYVFKIERNGQIGMKRYVV